MQTGQEYPEHESPPKIPSLSLAGQTVIVNQAVLLAPVHHDCSAFPRKSFLSDRDTLKSGIHEAASLAVTVAGPRRTLPASLLSLATPDPYFMILHIICKNMRKHCDYTIF